MLRRITGAAVHGFAFLLVILAVRGRNTPGEHPADPQICSQPESQPDRIWPQMIALSILFAIFTVAGFGIRPSEEAPLTFTGPLVVEAPGALIDSQGVNYVKGILWSEAHGQALTGLEPTMIPLPPVEIESTRIVVAIGFQRDVQSDVPFRAMIDLPEQATLGGCNIAGLGEHAICAQIENPHKSETGRSRQIINISGTLPKQAANGVVVFANIRGAPGMSFVGDSRRTAVRYPRVFFDDAYNNNQSVPPAPIGVATFALVPDPANMGWSDTPKADTSGFAFAYPNGGSSIKPENILGWQYKIQETGVPPPNIFGTNQKSVNEDSDRLFYSGILFGVGGGALVTTVQVVVIAAFRRPKTRS